MGKNGKPVQVCESRENRKILRYLGWTTSSRTQTEKRKGICLIVTKSHGNAARIGRVKHGREYAILLADAMDEMHEALREDGRVVRMKNNLHSARLGALKPQLGNETALVEGKSLRAARMVVHGERLPAAHMDSIYLNLSVGCGESRVLLRAGFVDEVAAIGGDGVRLAVVRDEESAIR